MLARRAITIRGVVQGVGFRPFAHGLAARLSVAGSVRNHGDAVVIEAEGEAEVLDELMGLLRSSPPPLARIDAIDSREEAPRGESAFRIEASEARAGAVDSVPADVATCDECRREIFDPCDRRYRYPFTNCTGCGPRLTVIGALPYDRARTTMAAFALCAACRAEYEDPANRRFHAEPIACPDCGPRLAVREDGATVAAADAVAYVARRVRDGAIVAVKGLGGYHLAVDATNAAAVARLRQRKGRDAKPFAVMVADLAAAERLAVLEPAERALLGAPEHPIVLVRPCDLAGLAPGLAPGLGVWGLMLPYTPLHHLLMDATGGLPLVMTSGNASDGPIAFDDTDAEARLAPLADVFLIHDRPIHVACDDSVVRVIAGVASPIRRARGYAPLPLSLPLPLARPTLALGGQMKATFALGRARRAVVSHHLGDLDDLAALERYEWTLQYYERLYGFRPERLVHDLHPDYASTRYAEARAARDGIATLAVPHHHAHMASVLAEHGFTGAAIGIVWDGTGLGTDGALWGGEFLVGDAARFRRAAHLAYVPLPGGARAVREPWRMALAHLRAAGETSDLLASVAPRALATVERMIERNLHCPRTSSVGRLFDAVAALTGVALEATFEGEAAMRLEAMATTSSARDVYPVGVDDDGETVGLDPRPLVRAIADERRRGVPAADIARRFHLSLAAAGAAVCARIRAAGGPDTVALSGGVFMNGVLTPRLCELLVADGFRVLTPRAVPANDGGLSLGQLAVAAARDREA